ncbi:MULTISPECIES: outer membrane beta-barrel protein [Bizionia]|nr:MULTISPECIES: outer membrane beta-barrel protein [Bizionia]OBX22969.1 hypothetical protein BAA08_06770 [Bizionia sp. APA-3]
MIPRSITTFGLLFFVLFTLHSVKAQPKKGPYIKASLGLGASLPFDDADVSSNGFYAQGEYVFGISRWFGLRPYVGVMLASSHNDYTSQPQLGYQVSTSALLLGGKLRFAIPIPWVAPYVETGIGTSIGSFTTITPYTNVEKNGFVVHIPVTYGLAIGRNHNFEIELTFYYHPSIDNLQELQQLAFHFPFN